METPLQEKGSLVWKEPMLTLRNIITIVFVWIMLNWIFLITLPGVDTTLFFVSSATFIVTPIIALFLINTRGNAVYSSGLRLNVTFGYEKAAEEYSRTKKISNSSIKSKLVFIKWEKIKQIKIVDIDYPELITKIMKPFYGIGLIVKCEDNKPVYSSIKDTNGFSEAVLKAGQGGKFLSKKVNWAQEKQDMYAKAEAQGIDLKKMK